MDGTKITLIPRLSEKAFALSQDQNTFVFVVPKSASQAVIANAVKTQFNVEVVEVRMINQKGKSKRTIRKGRAVPGRNSDMKKAYVKLAAGNTLPFFQSETEVEDKKESK
jgi:large subunit ribosomal protein L23